MTSTVILTGTGFFIQVRKFRESRKKNTEEEDKEVREVIPLNFARRLKNGVVTFAYKCSDLAMLQQYFSIVLAKKCLSAFKA